MALGPPCSSGKLRAKVLNSCTWALLVGLPWSLALVSHRARQVACCVEQVSAKFLKPCLSGINCCTFYLQDKN